MFSASFEEDGGDDDDDCYYSSVIIIVITITTTTIIIIILIIITIKSYRNLNSRITFVKKSVLYLFDMIILEYVGEDNVDGMANRYGDRIPVGVRFSAPDQKGPSALPASSKIGTGSFPGEKWPGCGDIQLAPGLKKEYSYTINPSHCCHGRL